MNWSKQSQRLYDYVKARPNVDIPQPELNKAAAGDGLFVNSFTKRVSEVRARIRSEGGDFLKTHDEWHGGQRKTWYCFYE